MPVKIEGEGGPASRRSNPVAEPLETLPPPQSDGQPYDVGYGRPPVHSRFKKGQSGNSRGRPKGSKNLDTIIKEIAFEPVAVTIRGRKRKVPMLEVALRQLMKEAVKGDRISTMAVTGLVRSVQVDVKAEDAPIPDNELAAIENLIALRGLKRDGETSR